MVFLCQRHRLIGEERGVGHLNCGLDAVFMCDLLLEAEDIQRLAQELAALFQTAGFCLHDGFGIFRQHFGAVDDVENQGA
ncbi:hypothetical protein SDC9_121343 [bioreactor metagenome]|uniref:Uncharacterized protein n=1 Tax=bioreactor metagenome TaxID=1076179 RepID=A0A645CBQ1_9ZZZZ